jgi:PAS domain S-box-containing protein
MQTRKGLNRLLEEQVKNCGFEVQSIPEAFIKLVNETYNRYGADTGNEGATQLTHKELEQFNRELKNDISERILAVSRLMKLNERYELALKASNDGIWDWDITTNKIAWNEGYCKLFGYLSGQQESADSRIEKIHPDDRQGVHDGLNKAIWENGNTHWSSEYRFLKSNGSYAFVYDRGIVIYDDKGKPVRMVGTIQDVTERKEAEARLINTNREFEILFSTIDEAFFSIDLVEGKLMQISSACRNIYGFNAEDFYSNHWLWYDVIHPDDKFDMKELYDLFASGEQAVKQYRIICKDESIRWVETKIIPEIENGKILRLNGITRDITGARNMQEELIESEKHNRNLFDRSTVGMVLARMDGTLVDVNSAYSEIIGYTVEEAKKLSYWDITPAEYSAEEEQKLIEMGLTGKYRSYEKEYIHKDGHRVPVKMSGVIIEKGGQKYILSNVEDITESHQQKNAIISKNAELRKTNAELDRFVYSVSHDLRAPLCSILGIVEVTEEEVTDEFTRENLSHIKQGVKRLDTFIHDILDYSRNSRTEIKSAPVCFGDMISEITQDIMYMNNAGGKIPQISISVHEPVSFQSDVSRMKMVLNNLLANAIRYADPAKKNIEVYVKVNVDDAGAVIEISDNGIGIPEQFHTKVFEMFFRVSEKSVGSGLGLYIVKEAVEKLNGTIDLASQPGTGTTFRITLPTMVNNDEQRSTKRGHEV